MRGPGYWIVIALLLCVFIGSVLADGPHGEMSSYADQGYSGGSSVDNSEGDDSSSPGNHAGSVSSDSPGENSGTTTITMDYGVPGDVVSSPSLDQGSIGAGVTTGSHEGTPGSNDEASSIEGNPGSTGDSNGPDDRGSTTARADSGDSNGPDDRGLITAAKGDSNGSGNPAGSAGSDDRADAGAGLATGYNSLFVNPDKGGSISWHPGGAETSPLQGGGGEWSNAAQGQGSSQVLEGHSQNAGGGAGTSGSVQKQSPTALREDDPVTGQNDRRGAMGIMAASVGSAGIARSGFVNPGGYSAPPDADRESLPQRQQRGPPEQATHYPCGPAETSPVTPAQGQGRDEIREENTPRSRPKRLRILAGETDPGGPAPTTPSPSRTPLFPFSMLLFGGYRRITKKNVLEQDARSTLYRTITNNPGIDVPTLAGITGLNENTLRYHLVKLIANGKVTYLVKPGVIRYFLNQGAYSRYEQVFLHYLWSETPREILQLLRRTPGLTRQQISDSLGISGPSVTRQMDHMREDRVIENLFPGRSNHYYLTDEAMTIFERVISRTSGPGGNEDSRQPLPAFFGEGAPEPSAVY
jgi:DNA-binding MarR family transcriptional regulator